ncbi:hypothetical protein GME_11212 [Halomonas sp. TD01]|nr:hypothetical protein GME_11212 [Halomonas sp. TD01]
MFNNAMWHELLQKYNAVNTRGLVVKVKPQRKKPPLIAFINLEPKMPNDFVQPNFALSGQKAA